MALNDYDPLFESAGRQYNVDPQLLKAVAYTESRGNPSVVSGAGAQGVMQFMPATAKQYGIDPFDPKQAIPAAAKYISEGLQKYGSPEGALMYYAGGPNQAIWGEKTRGYPSLVADAYGKVGKSVASAAPAQNSSADDAFSAAFAPPTGKTAPEPANDAFSAAFAPPSPGASSAPGAKPTPQADGVHLTGLTGIAVDALRGKLGSNPIIEGLQSVANSGRAVLGNVFSGENRLAPPGAVKDTSLQFSDDPNKEYGYILPFAQDKRTGANELAMPGVLRPIFRSADALLQTAEGQRYMSPADKGIAGLQVASAVPNVSVASRVTAGLPVEAAADGAAQNRLAPPALDPWTGRPPVAPQNPLMPPEAIPVQQLPEAAPAAPVPSPAQPAAAAWGPAAPEPTAMGVPEKLPPKPLLPIITQAGAEKQADRIIAHFAQNGPTDINAQELIPGSTPTLSQATGNAGIATLERAFRDVNPNLFVQRAAANGDARAQALLNVTGVSQDIDAAEAARESATSALRDAAFAPGNVDKADARPVIEKIDEILASPAGKRDAVQNALTNIRSKLVNTDAKGVQTLESDPEQLYGVRKAINDSLSPLAAGTKADGRQAARELMQVQDTLDSAIESGAPGFQKYIQAYSDASRPIDAMRYLQSLNLTDTKGNITLGNVDRAVKAIQKQQAANGTNAAKSVTDEQLNLLTAIRDDLRRQQNESLGKSIGSNTFQNLATNSTMAALSGDKAAHLASIATGAFPPLGIPLAIGRYGLNKLGSRGEAMVQEALQNRLLTPETARRALSRNGAARLQPQIEDEQ
jgi:hypothetical protein